MSPTIDKLNSVSETVVCIPYEGSDEHNEDHTEASRGPEGDIFTPSFLRERDLPDGPRRRMNVYKEAWERCKRRMQESINELYSPITEQVLRVVRDAYTREEPLIARTELPTIVISGADRSATSAVVSDVERLLNEGDAIAERGNSSSDVYVSSISSADCTNVPSAMKALIGGFVRRDPEDMGEAQSVKRAQKYPSSSVLAPYDLNVLEAWYRAVQNTRNDNVSPKLAVLVHDFENIDPAVMHDVFYICSLHIPRLPLVFILSCASPSQTSFLHAAYPRTAITLLGLTKIDVRSGVDVLEHVLLKTFFDVNFDSVVIPSPATLDFIAEQFCGTSTSLDLILKILQLVFLRHFTEPLTVLAIDELLGEPDEEDAAELLEKPSSRPFLNALLARLHHPEKSKLLLRNGMDVDEEEATQSPSKRIRKGKARADTASRWRVTSTSEVLQLAREAREVHKKCVVGSRTAFQVFLLARNYILENGFKSLLETGYRGEGRKGVERTVYEMMINCVRGSLTAKDGRPVAAAIRKLPEDHLSALLSEVYSFVRSLPTDLRRRETETMTKLVEWNSRIGSSPDEIYDVRKEVNEWFLEYLSERMRDYTETNLWDIWYTKNPQGISELFNPSPRTTIVTALVHPDRYLDIQDDPKLSANSTPDTCILFQRYLESGRMLNVYDWFESFSSALTAQRKRSRKQAREDERKAQKGTPGHVRNARRAQKGRKRASRGDVPSSPSKRGRGRGKGRGLRATIATKRKLDAAASSSDSESDSGEESKSESEEEDEEAKELWTTEVHARFIRAVQELDFMGFIKHTRRKADHVHKTVYDVSEYLESSGNLTYEQNKNRVAWKKIYCAEVFSAASDHQVDSHAH